MYDILKVQLLFIINSLQNQNTLFIKIYNEKYLNYINIYEDYFDQIKEANSYIMGLETGRESVMGIIDYCKGNAE